MAFVASTIWDVRSGGSDANGGGFSPLITNMATDLEATDANTASPVVTSASYTFIARDVGHWLYVGAGTNWTPGWYEIASVAGGAATLSAAAGAGYLSTVDVPYAITTAAGCATVASPTGGTWSVDYSQSTPISFTDLVIDAVTNTDFTSVLTPLGKNFIGNVFNVTSGTGFTVQRVQVLSNPSGVIARADKSMGTLASTGGNATAGGPLVTPGQADALNVASNTVFIGAATYDMSNSASVAGGKVADATAGTAALPCRWIGWNTTRHILNSDSTRPLCRANANSVTCWAISGSNQITRNIDFGVNGSPSSVNAVNLSGLFCRVENSTISGTFSTGFSSSQATNSSINLKSFGSTTAISLSAGHVYGFVANGPVSLGGAGNCSAQYGVIYGGSGQLSLSGNGSNARNITVYGLSGTGGGVALSSGIQNVVLANILSYGNGTSGAGCNYADASATNVTGSRLINCAGGGGFAADDISPLIKENFITLTEDPFTDAAGGNFTLNDAAGGGALLKAAGFPTEFPGLTGIANSVDVGAYQTASTGGGFISTSMSGGMI